MHADSTRNRREIGARGRLLGRPALSESRSLRLFSVFILYLAQGIPLGLFWFAVPAWMAANGADADAVAYVLGLAALPWSLKLVNGFIMDRYTFLAMGRRRIWLIGAQLVLVASLAAGALASPQIGQVWLLGLIGFVVNVATAFQDVAVDGLAVDILEEEERARAGGLMFGGQSIGMALSTALSGAAIAAYGPRAAYLSSALFIALVTMFIIAVRERPGERLLPWSAGEPTARNVGVQAGSWWLILKHVTVSMVRPVSLLYAPLCLVKGMQYGLLTGATPLIAAGSAGWAEARIAAMTGAAQLIAGLLGMTLGGVLGDRLGAKWASILFYSAWLLLNAAMFLAQPLWADSTFITAYIIVWIALDTLITIALLPIAMRLCDPAVAATQFALYMMLNNLGITAGAWLLGLADVTGGIAPLLVLLAVMDAGAIAILLIVRFPTRRIKEEIPKLLVQPDGLSPATG